MEGKGSTTVTTGEWDFGRGYCGKSPRREVARSSEGAGVIIRLLGVICVAYPNG